MGRPTRVPWCLVGEYYVNVIAKASTCAGLHVTYLSDNRYSALRTANLPPAGLQIDDVGCKVTKDHFSHILKHVGEEPMFYEQFHEFLFGQ